jgi:hypothetical protein
MTCSFILRGYPGDAAIRAEICRRRNDLKRFRSAKAKTKRAGRNRSQPHRQDNNVDRQLHTRQQRHALHRRQQCGPKSGCQWPQRSHQTLCTPLLVVAASPIGVALTGAADAPDAPTRPIPMATNVANRTVRICGLPFQSVDVRGPRPTTTPDVCSGSAKPSRHARRSYRCKVMMS